jgi:hypothetical protein
MCLGGEPPNFFNSSISSLREVATSTLSQISSYILDCLLLKWFVTETPSHADLLPMSRHAHRIFLQYRTSHSRTLQTQAYDHRIFIFHSSSLASHQLFPGAFSISRIKRS